MLHWPHILSGPRVPHSAHTMPYARKMESRRPRGKAHMCTAKRQKVTFTHICDYRPGGAWYIVSRCQFLLWSTVTKQAHNIVVWKLHNWHQWSILSSSTIGHSHSVGPLNWGQAGEHLVLINHVLKLFLSKRPFVQMTAQKLVRCRNIHCHKKSLGKS